MLKNIFLLMLALAGIGAFAYWQFKPEPVVSVSTVAVEKRDIVLTLNLVGEVINDQTVTMTALLDGEIISIKAREGDAVSKGDTLAELDSQEANTLLDKAKAELQYQQQNVVMTTRNHQRLNDLSQAGNASKQSLDDALNAKLSAEAAVKVAATSVTLSELRMQNARIEAPFDGTVVLQSAEIGQWVEAGTRLFTIVSDSGNVIEAEVDSSEWSRVSLEQVAQLSTDAIPDMHWPSTVKWIAPNISEDSGNTFAVRFSLGDDTPAFLLGQELDVDLELDRVTDVLTVPLQALIEESPGQFFTYVSESGEARRRTVELGLKNLIDAEVTAGLNKGDVLILPGRYRLFDGMPIGD